MKTNEALYQEMLAFFTEATGFAMDDSADLAVRLRAAAAQLESLYAYCGWTLEQCFPQTAAGQYLDAHGALRSIERKAGGQAEGVLRFSVGEARADQVTIPAGTACTTAGLVRFVTTEAGSIPAGSLYTDVPAMAEEPGAAGNAAAGTVNYLTQPPVGVTACTNPVAFSGGLGQEDDESLRTRILSSFARLPNGANKAFYEERALSHEGVGGVTVLPRVNGRGTVGVVIAGMAGLPDEALVQEVYEDLQSVREIAVDVIVTAPEAVTVDVAATLWPADNVTFDEAAAAVEEALGGYFTGGRLGKPVYRAELYSLLFGTGKLKNLELTVPAADVEITGGQLPQLGAAAWTEGT